MDYDNDKEIQPNITSVVRRRSRDASTRHHTSPARYIHHEDRSGDDLPVLSPHRQEKVDQDIAGLGSFQGFTAAPDVIFDEPFVVPSKPLFREVHDPIPPPVITAGHKGPPSALVASERLGLLLCQPPNVMRSISDESTSSSQSAGSATISIDAGHNGLIPAIGTTNKFTHKWPTPKSLSHDSQLKQLKDARSIGLRPNQSPASALEDGQGLGSRHVARWTTFKWCLLLSAMTVFAYGATGLICALMTWFKSQLIFGS
ncbi:hypothetical protein BYT27DRAFT_6941228 [Phlegmacium glaucopus]|nr:hypothetical protein BYT27DRAFT_6941228 [Phlegmacium glaucopus]